MGQPIVHTPVCTRVCTNVCTLDFSNAFISSKNEENAMKLAEYYPLGLCTRYIKNVMDDPLCVPLFIPLTYQMLIFQPKMKKMPQKLQDMILRFYTVHQECLDDACCIPLF